MRKIVWILPILLLVALPSCRDKKSSAYNQLHSLYNNVSKNHDKFTQKDWEKFLHDYERIDSLLDLYEYTSEQYEEIGELKGRCAAYAVKAYGNMLQEEIDYKINEFTGFLEGFSSEIKN